MNTILLLIALQQGVCALAWFVGGWILGLSKRAASHWIVATLASGMALSGTMQRGDWPDWITYGLVNLLALAAFVAMRRGVQVFLRLPVTDGESALLFVVLLSVMLGFGGGLPENPLAVLVVSGLMAWLLLRTATEAWRGLRAGGDMQAAVIVCTPLAALGAMYALRALFGTLQPELAAQPLHHDTPFNVMLGAGFILVGLVLNLVLGYMVVSRLVGRLQRLSQRDALTGLLNRRALQPLLVREAGRLKRYGEPYAVLMIDVDHFKLVNDRYGHAVGDAALVTIAGLLRDAAREVDQVLRLGGEEFCLLLPHTGFEGALELGRRVTEQMRAAIWRELSQPLTVSIGVAVALDPAEQAEQVMKRADDALYRAKALGRNRVELADPPALGIVPA